MATGGEFMATGGEFMATGVGFVATGGGFMATRGGFMATGGGFMAKGGGFTATGCGFTARYHTWCVMLDDVPEGDWFCERCSANRKPPPPPPRGVGGTSAAAPKAKASKGRQPGREPIGGGTGGYTRGGNQSEEGAVRWSGRRRQKPKLALPGEPSR
eukprot:161467-Prorocentrum_minimum.AAC.2